MTITPLSTVVAAAWEPRLLLPPRLVYYTTTTETMAATLVAMETARYWSGDSHSVDGVEEPQQTVAMVDRIEGKEQLECYIADT
jgi:hypothetical protein